MRTDYKIPGQFSGSDGNDDYAPTRDSHTTAWVVLSLAFVVFWILVIGSFVGAKHYYDTATVAQGGTLSLEQGIVLFRDAVSSTLVNAHDGLALREGDELLVGQGARASVHLFDGSTVLLYSGSELRLDQLRRSRFHDGSSTLDVRLNKGTARIEVQPSSTRISRFRIFTPHGSALLEPGNFGVEVDDNQTRISSRMGTASAIGNGGSADLGPGQKVLLGKDAVAGPMPEGDEMVQNGDFSQGFARWTLLNQDEPGRPAEPGQRALVTEKIGGRESIALRVARVSPLETHNETGLSQVINRDVSDYQAIMLRANIRVDDQSLSGGGYMGYEYPIMIRIRYRDATGGQIDWSHGFYAKNPENRPTPNGEGVPQNQWISYTGNLMDVQPRPVYIISMEVLGAGHTFEGMIANVSLVGK